VLRKPRASDRTGPPGEIPIDDFRLSSLARFLKMRLETGEMDIEGLALEGLAFLRRLDRARVADGEDYEDVRRGRRASRHRR
jgi:hypothetical protein